MTLISNDLDAWTIPPFSQFDGIDFLLRAAFLFLIALPIGLFSGIMRRDKEKIDALNADLRRSLDELKRLHSPLRY